MLRTLIFAAVLLLASSFSRAADLEVRYLGGLEEFPQIEYSTTAECIVGNTGQPGGWLTDESVFGSLGLAMTFDPLAFDCPCDAGFTVEALHLVVVKLTDQSVEWPMSLALGDAFLRDIYPEDADCFEPTPCPPGSYGYPQYCGAYVSAPLAEPGYYEVVISGDLEPCGCIHTTYTHTIVSRFPQLDEFGVRLVTDDDPGHCPDHFATSYYMGACFWTELEAPGSLLFWAEVSCCEPPVATESTTWTGIKSMYR